MSTNKSSSSAKRTDAVPVNSFITGKYLKGRKISKLMLFKNMIVDRVIEKLQLDRL